MPIGSRPSSPLTLPCHARLPGPSPGGPPSSLILGPPSTRPLSHTSPPETPTISQLFAQRDALTSQPLRRPCSLIGRVTSHLLPPPQSGRPRSSPLEDRAPGAPPFLTRTLPKASTWPYSHISFPLHLLQLTLPSLSLPILTTFLLAMVKSPLYSQSPPTLPPQALTRSPTMCGNRSTGRGLPCSPPSSPLCYNMVTLPPP